MQKEVNKKFSNYEVTNQNQMRKNYEDKIREENKRIAEVQNFSLGGELVGKFKDNLEEQ